jgi:hypothetical protein
MDVSANQSSLYSVRHHEKFRTFIRHKPNLQIEYIYIYISSGVLRTINCLIFSQDLNGLSAFILGLLGYDNEGNVILQNVGNHFPVDLASRP